MSASQPINLTVAAKGRISVNNLTEYQLGIVIDRALLGTPPTRLEQDERLDLRTLLRDAWDRQFGGREPNKPSAV